MRRAALHELVAGLVRGTFDGGDTDVADRVLEDREDDHGCFAVLCRRLVTAGGDSKDGVETAWAFVADQVDDYLKDRIVDGSIAQPALYLGALT